MSQATHALPAATEVSAPTVTADFDLDLTVLPVGDNPDVHRIFASETQAPCQCNTQTCH